MSLSRLPALQALPDVLPESFGLPDPVYYVPVLFVLIGVTVILYLIGVDVNDWTVVALAPWIAIGGVFHVLYRQSAFFPEAEPLFGNPMVYLTTAAIAGVVWIVSVILADMRGPKESPDRQMMVFGASVLVTLVGFSLWVGAAEGSLEPLWPTVGLALSGVVAAATWVGITLVSTETVSVSGKTGMTVLFAHVLDGISTAIGIDLLGMGEQTPLAAAILDFAAGLPTAEYSVGWLFVVVKILLAAVVLYTFREFVDESPEEARLVLLFVAAVGLGPGTHNLLLFVVEGSTLA